MAQYNKAEEKIISKYIFEHLTGEITEDTARLKINYFLENSGKNKIPLQQFKNILAQKKHFYNQYLKGEKK
jgi:hypothetical protein